MNKVCKTCNTTKTIDQFKPRKWGKSGKGYESSCRKCMASRRRESHDFLQNKNELLRSRFGMTLDDYNSMFILQSGCCAICVTPQSALKKSLCVDHDHKTGVIRGLLCDNCNRAIGQLKDSAKILTSALNYVSKSQESLQVIPINVSSKRYRKHE